MAGRRIRRRRRKRAQNGGASVSTVRRIMHKGPPLRDKIAEDGIVFLSGPEPSFSALGRLLGKQAFKGVSDNVKGYIRRR